MRKTKANTIKDLDTGKLLREIVNNQNLSTTALSRKMQRHHTTVASMLKKSSIQAYLLWELSLALKHNFFSDLAQQLDQSAGAAAFDNGQNPIKTQLALLENENKQLREERDYLRKAVDAMSKG